MRVILDVSIKLISQLSKGKNRKKPCQSNMCTLLIFYKIPISKNSVSTIHEGRLMALWTTSFVA